LPVFFIDVNIISLFKKTLDIGILGSGYLGEYLEIWEVTGQ
jgi:hypothetical protein